MMTWRKVKGKYIISSNGVHKAFTEKELRELKQIINDIETGSTRHYKERA